VSLFAISGLAHAQQSQNGNQALGGLIDVVVNNTSVLNQADILNNRKGKAKNKHGKSTEME